MTADLRSPLPRLSMRAMSWPASFYIDVRDKLDLNPPYQRGSVWDDARRRNLVRSLLMGLPIGSVVLNRRDHTNTATGYVAVVDGKQRIETLRAVADGLLPIPAVWVDERFQGRTQTVDIDGESISCVVVDRDDHPFLRVLGDFQLPAVEAKVKTIAEEAELFELINFGGVAQTDADRARAAEIAGS